MLGFHRFLWVIGLLSTTILLGHVLAREGFCPACQQIPPNPQTSHV